MPSNFSSPRSTFRLNVPAPHAEHIAQFRSLYQRHYGELLDEQMAATQLYDLLALVRYRDENGQNDQKHARTGGKNRRETSAPSINP